VCLSSLLQRRGKYSGIPTCSLHNAARWLHSSHQLQQNGTAPNRATAKGKRWLNLSPSIWGLRNEWVRTYELPSPGRSHYTNYWYSWVQIIYNITREINQKHRRASHHCIHLENRVFSTWRKVCAEGAFVNDSNMASWHCKMGLTSLHEFHGSWHLYICGSVCGNSTFLVVSLVFMKGTSCCVIRINFKWNRAVMVSVIGLHDFRCYLHVPLWS